MLIEYANARLAGSGVSQAGPGSMAEFLQRIADRADVEAFRELFQTYGPRVKAYLMRHGADATTAEELTQETLLTVWRKAGLYSESRGSAATWIFTIARNLRIDRLRKELTWVALPETYEELPTTDPLPDQLVSEAERKLRVQAALAALPAEYYEVVTLSYIEGLSHSQIAQRLSLPVGTVKTRMRVAYFKIRSAVEDLM